VFQTFLSFGQISAPGIFGSGRKGTSKAD